MPGLVPEYQATPVAMGISEVATNQCPLEQHWTCRPR